MTFLCLACERVEKFALMINRRLCRFVLGFAERNGPALNSFTACNKAKTDEDLRKH